MAIEYFKEFPHSPLPTEAELSEGEVIQENQRFNNSAGYKLAELNNPKEYIMSCNLDNRNVGTFELPLCLPMSEVYFGFVTSFLAVGGLIGSIFSSKLADPYGRKNSLIMNSIIMFVGSMFEAFAFSPFMLLFGRFVSGIGAGIGFAIVPMYLTEIAPLEYRGFLNMFNALGVTSGVFISQVMGHFLNKGHGWRIVLGVGIFLSIISGISLLYIVESPRYLYCNNQENESKYILCKLRGTQYVENELRSWKHCGEQNEQVKNDPQSYLSINEEQSKYFHEFDGTEQRINFISIFRTRKYRQAIILDWPEKTFFFLYDIYVCKSWTTNYIFDMQIQLYVGYNDISYSYGVCSGTRYTAVSSYDRAF
ncbi:putative metabolite transport protein [Smittium mucronatum]|uniref:Putative metabolite transport protein n=1 Tax=Smittium mucronatum TaxID=133383 RepID=A0A1R0GVP3_9FUNG|nr:putative metabolite transport protein [Smittium mucronatum]